MKIKWQIEAEKEYLALVKHCADVFGRNATKELVISVEATLAYLTMSTKMGKPEVQLQDYPQSYLFLAIRKRVKLVYRVDKANDVIYIVDCWHIPRKSKTAIARGR
ncbi:MAG: hypothetical protein RR365_05060 [Bacteroides sp.]